MKVSTECPLCGATSKIECGPDAYRAWRLGISIQHALPNLSPDERERLQTGMCADCWDRLRKEEGE
jgi:hypothetical protein